MNPKLERFIATRDKQIMKVDPVAFSPPLLEKFNVLLRAGRVIVGGRASCGPKVDPTWRIYSAWNEVVDKANKLGYQITRTPIKHGNAWATKAGGFWTEYEYSLESTQSKENTELAA